MKTHSIRYTLAALLFALCLIPAQSFAAESERSKVVLPDSETICLSPVYVTTDEDVGYVPVSTLAGTRIQPDGNARPRMEVVFVLDTTGSMGSMIEGAKRKVWAVASKLKSAQPTPDIRFGLVAYRDRGDEYVTRHFPLTTDIDAIYGELMKLTANGGGDTPESVNEALATALSSSGWSEDKATFRAIFLIGDAPPHYYADDVPWKDLARTAAERGIVINGLQCGGDQETSKVWQGIARIAGGATAQILDENRTVPFEYRFDADIVGMNRALETTIIPYGSAEELAAAGNGRRLLQAMTAEGVADRASFLGKGEYGAILTGGGDLVAEIIAGRVDLKTIDTKRLDRPWAAKNAKARATEITRLVERRRTLLKEITVLLKERESLLAAKLSGAKSDDERLVLSPFAVVETQAKQKGFRFE